MDGSVNDARKEKFRLVRVRIISWISRDSFNDRGNFYKNKAEKANKYSNKLSAVNRDMRKPNMNQMLTN